MSNDGPKHPQFTLKRMMIAVAILAVLLGVWIEIDRQRRLASYRQRAAAHAELERDYSQKADRMLRIGADRLREAEERLARYPSPGAERDHFLSNLSDQRLVKTWAEQDAAVYRATALAHARAKRKYEAASSRPWMSIRTDDDPPTNERQKKPAN